MVAYVGLVYGPIGAFLAEYFPGRIRYTSVSVPYHIGNGWGGGLVPFITTAAYTATGSLASTFQRERTEFAVIEIPSGKLARAWANQYGGSASVCSRAARFGVSPIMACSAEISLNSSSLTTTVPVAMPIRT